MTLGISEKITVFSERKNLEYDILIIDDSKYVIDFLTKIINIKGYTCKSVYNISKAKKELEVFKPKLIFLDVNLPDSNGYEFCKSLKTDKNYRNILVYFFTGEPESEVALKALETGADGYLKKPFNIIDFDEIFEHFDQN
ncbi:MAG TPA: response regulator [archaeon]|nr:response regulator [archaeon]